MIGNSLKYELGSIVRRYFDETKIKRDDGGQFATKSGGGGRKPFVPPRPEDSKKGPPPVVGRPAPKVAGPSRVTSATNKAIASVGAAPEHNPFVAQPKNAGVEKPKPKPTNSFESVARANGLEPKHLAVAANELYKVRKEDHAKELESRKRLLKRLGIRGALPKSWHSVNGFVDRAKALAKTDPSLGLQRVADLDHYLLADAVWKIIASPIKAPVKSDPDLLNDAARMLKNARARRHSLAPKKLRYELANILRQPKSDAWGRFRYEAAKVIRYAWSEYDHPRDDGGQFSSGGGVQQARVERQQGAAKKLLGFLDRAKSAATKPERKALAKEVRLAARETARERRRQNTKDFRAAVDSFDWPSGKVAKAVRQAIVDDFRDELEYSSGVGEEWAGLAAALLEPDGVSSEDVDAMKREIEEPLAEYPDVYSPNGAAYRGLIQELPESDHEEVTELWAKFRTHLGLDNNRSDPSQYQHNGAPVRYSFQESDHPRDGDGKFTSDSRSDDGESESAPRIPVSETPGAFAEDAPSYTRSWYNTVKKARTSGDSTAAAKKVREAIKHTAESVLSDARDEVESLAEQLRSGELDSGDQLVNEWVAKRLSKAVLPQARHISKEIAGIGRWVVETAIENGEFSTGRSLPMWDVEGIDSAMQWDSLLERYAEQRSRSKQPERFKQVMAIRDKVYQRLGIQPTKEQDDAIEKNYLGERG